MENVVNDKQELIYSEIQEQYEKNKQSYDPNNQISKELISAGKTILDEFYDRNESTQFNVFDKEYEFKFVLGNYFILGYIDRIDVYDDEVIIIDYKTGKWEVAQKDIPTNLQLGLYAVAMSVLFPGKKITRRALLS